MTEKRYEYFCHGDTLQDLKDSSYVLKLRVKELTELPR
jgi:hypothetical protein